MAITSFEYIDVEASYAAFRPTYTERYKVCLNESPCRPTSSTIEEIITYLTLVGFPHPTDTGNLFLPTVNACYKGIPRGYASAAEFANNLTHPCEALGYANSVSVSTPLRRKPKGNYCYIITVTYGDPFEGDCDLTDFCGDLSIRTVEREEVVRYAKFDGWHKAQSNNCVDVCAGMNPNVVDCPVYPAQTGIDLPGGGEPSCYSKIIGTCGPVTNSIGIPTADITKRVYDVELNISAAYPICQDVGRFYCSVGTVNANDYDVFFFDGCWNGGASLFTIFKGQGLFVGADQSLQFIDCRNNMTGALQRVEYWQMDFTFLLRPCGWCESILNLSKSRLRCEGLEDGKTDSTGNPSVYPAGVDIGYDVLTDPQGLPGEGLILNPNTGQEGLLGEYWYMRYCPYPTRTWDFLTSC